MDVLSEVLAAVRLSQSAFLEAEFTAPWCVAASIGPTTTPDGRPAHIFPFHYVVEGRVVLEVAGEPPRELEAGEIVLLPRNDAHALGSGAGLRPVIVDDLVQPSGDPRIERLEFGGGGARARLVCGQLGTTLVDNPLMSALPRVMTVRPGDASMREWIANSFHFAAAESAARRERSPFVVGRLAEMLFVEAVRAYVDGLPPERRGWLAGLRDPVVGRALAALHARPAEPWTTEALAARVGLSRSAFADRFTQLVGLPPMRYLAGWRMQLAAQRLRETGRPVSQLAYEAGYESDAAFNRAFKRTFGMTPISWRRGGPGGGRDGRTSDTPDGRGDDDPYPGRP